MKGNALQKCNLLVDFEGNIYMLFKDTFMGIKEQPGVNVWQKPTQHCKVIIIHLKISCFFLKKGATWAKGMYKSGDYRNLIILFTITEDQIR